MLSVGQLPVKTEEIEAMIQEAYEVISRGETDETTRKRNIRNILLFLRQHPASFTRKLIELLHMLDEEKGAVIRRLAEDFPEPVKSTAIAFAIDIQLPLGVEPVETLQVMEAELTGMRLLPAMAPEIDEKYKSAIETIVSAESYEATKGQTQTFLTTDFSPEALENLLIIFSMFMLPSYIYLGVCQVLIGVLGDEQKVEHMSLVLDCLYSLQQEGEVSFIITKLLAGSEGVPVEDSSASLLDHVAGTLIIKLYEVSPEMKNVYIGRGILKSLLDYEKFFSRTLREIFRKIKPGLQMKDIYADLFVDES